MKTGTVLAIVAALVIAPTSALSQGKSGKGGGTHNPAPPKKNGRHDNRDWNKKDSDHRDADRDITLSPLTEAQRRQQTKNEWRNIAILSGGVALLGAINKDKTLVFAGAAGALYSLYRYEEDRKSQDKLARLRASYFSQPYFIRDGVRYNRRVMIKDGEKYYQFCRG